MPFEIMLYFAKKKKNEVNIFVFGFSIHVYSFRKGKMSVYYRQYTYLSKKN